MVGVNGENMGVVSYKSALEDAKKDKMGLLCVNGRSDPPVYRLMSRNDIHRKEKADRKKKHAQKPKPTKQITFSVKIHDHDRNTKVSHFVFRFSGRGNKTRPTNRHARSIAFFRKGIPCKSA
jgi:translation initiation factor IF-3